MSNFVSLGHYAELCLSAELHTYCSTLIQLISNVSTVLVDRIKTD